MSYEVILCTYSFIYDIVLICIRVFQLDLEISPKERFKLSSTQLKELIDSKVNLTYEVVKCEIKFKIDLH